MRTLMWHISGPISDPGIATKGDILGVVFRAIPGYPSGGPPRGYPLSTVVYYGLTKPNALVVPTGRCSGMVQKGDTLWTSDITMYRGVASPPMEVMHHTSMHRVIGVQRWVY